MKNNGKAKCLVAVHMEPLDIQRRKGLNPEIAAEGSVNKLGRTQGFYVLKLPARIIEAKKQLNQWAERRNIHLVVDPSNTPAGGPVFKIQCSSEHIDAIRTAIAANELPAINSIALEGKHQKRLLT